MEKKSSRIPYSPELHGQHGKSYTTSELAYMCSQYGGMSVRSIGFALGRTEKTVSTMIYNLKKSGEFERYRRMGGGV